MNGELYNGLEKLATSLVSYSNYLSYDPTKTITEINESEELLNNVYIMADPVMNKIRKYPALCIWLKRLDFTPTVSKPTQIVGVDDQGRNIIERAVGVYSGRIILTILGGTELDRDNISDDIVQYFMDNSAVRVYGDEEGEPDDFMQIGWGYIKDYEAQITRRDITLEIMLTKFKTEQFYPVTEIQLDIEDEYEGPPTETVTPTTDFEITDIDTNKTRLKVFEI